MNTTSVGKLHFPGGIVDRTNQLAFLSLADGQSNTYIGLNAGNKFPARLNCFVGVASGENTQYAMTSVYMGALSGQNSNRIGDTVAIGYGSARYARDCYSSVLIGSGSGSKLVRSELNTAVGHQSFSSVVSASRCVAVGAYSSRYSQAVSNNCYVGYACGQNSRGSESVYVGAMSAQVVTGHGVTSVGAGSLATTESATNAVVCGALGGEGAENIADVVMVGYGVGKLMANVSQSVVIGTSAGQNMTNSSYNVVAGHLTGQVMVNSSFNTFIGGLSASNVESKYTTVVGSGSMNRRNNERVEFSNCVVVGESIKFDLPIYRITLSNDDAVQQVSTGTTLYDPTHLFPGPYLQLVNDTIGNGSIAWRVEESRDDAVTLASSDRDIIVFSSLQINVGTWSLKWFVDDVETLTVFSPSKYECSLSITSDGLEYSIAMSVEIEGVIVATKTITVDIGPDVMWMDVTIHQKPSPQGIYIQWSLISNGISSPSTESALDSTALFDDYGSGFVIYMYAASHPRSSFVSIYATSPETLSPKSVYAVLEYNARRDERFTSKLILPSSTHTVDGSGMEANVNNQLTDFYELVLVDAPDYSGFTAARYIIEMPVAGVEIGAYFKVPASGSFGLEWFASEPTMESSLGDGYVMECIVNGDTISIVVYSSGVAIMQCVQDEIFGTYDTTLGGRNATIPLDISIARSTDEVWIYADISHTIGTHIVVTITVLGYVTGAYEARLPPVSSQQYVITILDGTEVDAEPVRDLISVYASGTEGRIAARDFYIRALQYRTVPLFERCVFIGSNFTVDQDVANTFVLSLGPDNQLINGTPDIFRIRSSMTQVDGSLVVGASSVSNYIAFRGLAGDGYEVDTPTTYIGERVYDEGTERTELLIFKGEDGVGSLGPDRVRILSGEFHVQTFTDSVANVYTYSRSGFMDAGNANAYTVMVANQDGLGILKTPDPGYELDINGSNARKLTGTTWLEGSDARIKTDIEYADTEECCRVMKRIPLKRFTYEPTYTGRCDNARVYGWLGQDVEEVIESAVTKTVAHGFDDFRTLDSDQLVKVMWGALQNVIRKLDAMTPPPVSAAV
jgi:hypothetical protein